MLTSRFVMSERAPLLQAFKSTAAAILAWLVCQIFFPEQPPIFGAIAALLTVQENVTVSLTRGLERIVGVVLGVTVAIAAAAVLGTHSWLFMVAILVSILLGWALRMTIGSANQIAISAMLMIALGGLSLAYGVERVVETLIGALCGIGINALIAAPVVVSPARAAINQLGFDTAEALRRLADALTAEREEPWLEEMLLRARDLGIERARIEVLLRRANDSLRLNPRGAKHRQRLAAEIEVMERVHPIVSQVIGMSRALYDNYDPELVEDRSVAGMAEEMRRAAHDLELLLDPSLAGLPAASPADSEPTLTAPYLIPRPHPVHWVLIGSLMEDLRRVRESITHAQDKLPGPRP